MGTANELIDQTIRVTVVTSVESLDLGELIGYQAAPAITGLGPGSSVGFDIQSVDPAGQEGETYRVDVVVPEVPC